jgi:probable phosphoglycerate mutase
VGSVGLNSGEADRTLIAYRIGGEPVGVVQFGEEAGEITLLCVCAEHRRKGYGVQMIGQAVQHWRKQGADRIWIRTGREWGCKSFLRDYGFSPDGLVMKKDIYFIPEYLSEE